MYVATEIGPVDFFFNIRGGNTRLGNEAYFDVVNDNFFDGS